MWGNFLNNLEIQIQIQIYPNSNKKAHMCILARLGLVDQCEWLSYKSHQFENKLSCNNRQLPRQNGIWMKLWLKVSIIICRYATRFFLEIPPCAHHVIFINEFVLLIKIHPFYEVNSFIRKWQANVGISNIFLLDHFSPSFLVQKC